MINLTSQLSKIEEQKKLYRILLNKSRHQSELKNQVWYNAAELASSFDLTIGADSALLQERNRKGLLEAFQTIRFSPKICLDLSFIKTVHAQALAFSNPCQGGVFRRMRARWLNSSMVVSNWEKIPWLMEGLVDGINQEHIPAFYWEEHPNILFQKFAHYPVMQAIESNYNTVAIHPFADGNKRAARLVSAWILDKYGHIPLSIYDREAYLLGVENYYRTREPQLLYAVMFDQMRKSYDHAICDIKAMEKRYFPANLHMPAHRKHRSRLIPSNVRQSCLI